MIEKKRALDTIVMKFGGTSVATADCWRTIADALREVLQEQEAVPVLVCSAISGVTDRLQTLCEARGESAHEQLRDLEQIHASLGHDLGVDAQSVLAEEFGQLRELVMSDEERDPAWKAKVIATGERLSTRLGHAWLSQSFNITWKDARTLLGTLGAEDASPETAYLSARCEHTLSPTLAKAIRQDCEAVITQGFVATNEHGETALLGRGGSDTSAAYMAAKLGAKRLEIWTDVPGLFTADPRRTHAARLLPTVSYDEAAVLGALGAKILHPRCLGPVQRYSIPLHVRWTQQPKISGTKICAADQQVRGQRSVGIKAVVSRSRLCLLHMRRPRRWQPVGFMADVSNCFHKHGISMDLISTSSAEIRATIDLSANPGARAHLSALLSDLDEICEVEMRSDMACLSLAGRDISHDVPRIADVLHLLETKVHLVSHAADDTHLSYVVDKDKIDALVASVHAAVFRTPTRTFGKMWRELRERNPTRKASSVGSPNKTRASEPAVSA